MSKVIHKIGTHTIFDDKVWIFFPEHEKFNQIKFRDIIKINVFNDEELFIDCDDVKYSFVMDSSEECLNMEPKLLHAIHMWKKVQYTKKFITLTLTITIGELK